MAEPTLTYRNLNYQSPEDLELMVLWHNDPAIKYLLSRFPTEESCDMEFTTAIFEREEAELSPDTRKLMVLADDSSIGIGTLEMDPPKLVTKTPNTAWIALVIGDQRFHRRGLGTKIVNHLEQLAIEAGAERIEVGIFEHNIPSLRLFNRLGYREFYRQPAHTWWNGRSWDVVRLLKPL